MHKKSVLQTSLSYKDIVIPIKIRKSPLSKKLVLKPCFKTFGGNITIPRNLSYQQGKLFAKKHLSWLHNTLSNNKYIDINSLEQINILGNNLLIKKVITTNKNIKFDINNNNLIVTSNHESSNKLDKVFKKFIKTLAKKYIVHQIKIKTHLLNISYNKVFLKDSISRWGSCSQLKNISINWRLVFAPKEVLDYVISHEVAHLVHFNHSKEFWSLVEKLHCNYKQEKTWLKEHGHTLYKIIIKN